MLIRATCGRCGTTVLSESHTLAERDLARLSEHVSQCHSTTTMERPEHVRPLGELLRYFEIAIDFA